MPTLPLLEEGIALEIIPILSLHATGNKSFSTFLSLGLTHSDLALTKM
jgi:hypothetical protein